MNDVRYVWIKRSPGSEWEIFREFGSYDETKSYAKRIQLTTRSTVAIGSSFKPILDVNERPLSTAYTKGGQTSHEVTPAMAEYPNTAQGALKFLKNNTNYSTAGALARPGSESGLWIVRHRNGRVLVDLNLNTVKELNEFIQKKT